MNPKYYNCTQVSIFMRAAVKTRVLAWGNKTGI